MKKLFIISIISLISLNNIHAQQYTRQYITDANKVALEWWEEINNNQYKKAYNGLSEILKNRFTLESWLNQMSMLMDEIC